MEHESDCLTIMEDVTDTAYNCSQIMEYRPNSKPEENSIALNTESLPLPLSAHYILTRAINVWDGPNYVTYRTNDARLKSFVIHEWPLERHPKPSALSDAGFFYTAKTYMIF